MYGKFDQNKCIPCCLRVMSIFNEIPLPAKMMLGKVFVTVLHTSV